MAEVKFGPPENDHQGSPPHAARIERVGMRWYLLTVALCLTHLLAIFPAIAPAQSVIGPEAPAESFDPFPIVDETFPADPLNSSSPIADPGLTIRDPEESEFLGLGDQGFAETDSAGRGQINFNDFPPEFLEGITLRQGRWAAKIGGYVKADLIHDFRAIDSEDFFEPATIPVGAPQRTNTSFHARQTRLNLDARWLTDTGNPMRILVEGDFFGDGHSLRLRHAYGEYEGLIVGQTWTTLTHRAALPNTLDNVGDVASVGRRQAQVRYSRHFLDDQLIIATAIEDSRVLVDDVFLQFGEPRTPLPDLILRTRWVQPNYQLQLAGVARKVAFQPTGQAVREFDAGGLNATALLHAGPRDRFYGGVLWGTGIGSYRELPDIAPVTVGQGEALESLAWYVGLTHAWSDRWQTNVTYSEGDVNNTPLQPAESIHRVQYLATNLIWQPTPHIFIGSELLWGMRLNNDGADQDASRVMVSFGFLLP